MKCVFYRRNVSEKYYNNFSFSTCQKKAQTVVNTLVGSKDIKNTEHTFDIFIRKSLEMMDNEVK
jgi:hypothetical protein